MKQLPVVTTGKDDPEVLPVVADGPADLLDLLAQGSVAPVITGRVPLAEVARVHGLLESAAISGKVVLVCGQV